ncbi:MAG: MBL fold metallo-hydrolase [Saprospiraceae bacterium]|nr:MBL fold metallo-hydrolase [Bacteroidia bacterium]NNE15613.1 MBL fold metallo-hydrolase [Saprospiraceae bacterium]NNL91392.1 MBL fold metallo-hydrolase [Saprospiraceae bacterium]
MDIAIFTFNAFQENTYVLYDSSLKCAIVDPGCNNIEEEEALTTFITSKNLTPVKLINTHCHIDHVLGNKFVSETYNLPLISHKGEKAVLDANVMVAKMYSIKYLVSPDITEFIVEGDEVTFGNTTLKVLFTPGHSPASISFFHKETNQLIAGDVLFQGSIGRTDLPGGDFDTLINSITSKFYPLGDDVIVYPGHGPSTTIKREKLTNPFLQ